MQDDIERPRDFAQMPLDCGAHPAANAIAHNGASQCLAHRKPYPRPCRSGHCSLAVNSAYIAGKAFLSLLVHSLKIRMPEQS